MSSRSSFALIAFGALVAGWWLGGVAEGSERSRQRGVARSGDAIGGQSLQLTSTGTTSGRASNGSASSKLRSGKVKAKHGASAERRQRTVAESGHAVGGQLTATSSPGDLVLVDRSERLRTLTDTAPEDLERLERPRGPGCAARISASGHADGRAYAMGVACEIGGRRVPIHELTVRAPEAATWEGFLAPTASCSFTPRVLTCRNGAALLLVLYGDLPAGSLITFTADGLTWTERAPP